MGYLSSQRLRHAGRVYETNNFYLDDANAWSYEVYDVDHVTGCNDYLEIRIPDLTPGASYTAADPDQVDIIAHGSPAIPLVIVLKVLQLAHEYGDLPAAHGIALPGD
jgi:hypothetical protein